METPANFFDSITVMPSGLGGNAADARSAKEHAAHAACNLNMTGDEIEERGED